MTDIQPYQPPTDSWVAVVEPVGDLATRISQTDFVPKDFRGKPAAVAAAILYGREVGLPPITSLRNIYVVHGTPDLSAEAQRALILSAGHTLEYVEVTGTRVVMRGCRRGSETWTEARYTLDEAKQSGDAAKNQNYRTRPQEMLIARCTSRLASMIFPDVVGGYQPAPGGDDQPAAGEPATVTFTAPRKAAKPRKPKPKPQQAPAAEAAPEGPPLPGEPGYTLDTDTGEIIDAEIIEEPAAHRITAPQLKKLHTLLTANGINNRDEGLAMIGNIVARDLDTTKDLSREEASTVIDTLESMIRQPEVPEDT